jgi:hypothetical protein
MERPRVPVSRIIANVMASIKEVVREVREAFDKGKLLDDTNA